jgi:hypothetical protein
VVALREMEKKESQMAHVHSIIVRRSSLNSVDNE